jgi:membrane fusion protein
MLTVQRCHASDDDTEHLMEGGKRTWRTDRRHVTEPRLSPDALPQRSTAGGNVPAKRPLFRQEVVEFQQYNRQWGRVVPLQPLSTRLMVWSVILASACVIVFLFVAHYARKEVAIGYLTPASGTARVFAAQTGTISAVYVEQGQAVTRGQPLLSVMTSQVAGNGEDVNAQILATLKQQKQALTLQMTEEVRRTASERDRLTAQAQELEHGLHEIDGQIAIQRIRIALLDQVVAAGAALRPKGLVSATDLEHRQNAVLEQRQALITLNQQLTAQQGKLTQVRFNLDQLKFTQGEKIQSLRNELSAAEQRIAEVTGRSAYVIKAPISGRISSLEASVGQQADPRRLQLQIVPTDSPLQAQLFIPISAIGFVEVGQEVRLLYDAFPYQRFGTYHGRITKVSQTVLMDTDIVAPVKLKEPVYTATVALAEPNIIAHGKKVALQPDMSLRADIILERRTLMDWIISPLRHMGVEG